MREILFRGRCEGLPWLYGSLLVYGDGFCEICVPDGVDALNKFRVDPETVGQYTGLTDKNGKKIFEGDVVTFETTAYSFNPCVVAWSFTKMRFIVRSREANYPMDIDFKYEVIGNIHDNPELLGGADNG